MAVEKWELDNVTPGVAVFLCEYSGVEISYIYAIIININTRARVSQRR